jgi:hypothetical protein
MQDCEASDGVATISIDTTITATRIGSLRLRSSDTDVADVAPLKYHNRRVQIMPGFKGQHRCPIDHKAGLSLSAQSLRDFPALKRRHCGASQCVSNFGLKFASRLNSLWRWIGRLGASSAI